MNLPELRLDRARLLAESDAADARADADSPSRAFVGRVVNGGAMGSGSNLYYLANPVAIGGTEAEGGAATRTVSAIAVPFAWLGPGSPTVGQDYPIQLCGDRWVAGAGAASSGGSGYGGCYCPVVPSRLQMTSSDHVGDGGIFQDATLTFRTDLGGIYLSDQYFYDWTLNESYNYLILCGATGFALTRRFAGGAGDATRYLWPLPASGNSCNPFSMTSGAPYPGATPVTVTLAPIS